MGKKKRLANFEGQKRDLTSLDSFLIFKSFIYIYMKIVKLESMDMDLKGKKII